MFDEYISMYHERSPLTIMYSTIQAIQSMMMSLIISGDGHVSPVALSIDMYNPDTPLDMSNVSQVLEVVTNSLSRYIIIPTVMKEHYLIMLLDKNERSYTIYDPSYDQTNAYGLLNTVTDILTKESGYKYDVIPYFMDFQHRTNDFFCSLWSMMVMVVSVNNHIHPSKVVDTLNTYDRDTLTRVVGGFIIFAYNTLIDLDLETLSYNVRMYLYDMKRKGGRGAESIDVVYNIVDPEAYITMQGWVMRDIPVRQLKTLYIHGIDTFITSVVEKLQEPMTISEFGKLATSIYTGKHKSIPSSWILGRIMDAAFTSTYDLAQVVRPISRMIAGGNIPTDKDLEKVKEVFSYSYDIDISNDYRIWSFVFEFYVRYLLLDTYDLPDCGLIMDGREERYKAILSRYNIDQANTIILTEICMYPPARYVDIEKFIYLVSTNPNRKEHIINSFIQSCLQRSPGLDRIHRERLESALSLI